MAPIRDSVSHSPNQTGLEHTGLDSQYEPSSWSSGSPCSTDSNPNWSKVLVDGSIDKSNSSSVWPPSSSSFSCSSSSSSSGCGSGSDPELASECMDADCSSSLGSDKSADVSTVKMMSASTSSVSSPSAAPPPSSTASTVMGVSINADPNGNKLVSISSGSSGNEAHYSLAGPNSIGSNNMGNHNKLNTSGVWGSQSDGNVTTPCINGALNPNMLKINANHGAWPQASQDQRTPQAKQGPLLGWGGMAAPENKMESTEANSGTTSTKVLGSSSSANGQSANLNNELNGPNNTIMMNTTTSTTSTTLTSTLPNSIASSQFTGDCSWGSIGGGNGGPLANGNHTQSTQGDLGGPGSFGTPWGATTYPGDKHVDTVNHQHPALMQAGNPQISSAAFKSNNNHNNTGASRWDQGPANNPAQSQSTLSWGGGQNQTPSSVSQSGNGNQTTMGPPTGMPRPWGSSASSSSSCSSSSSLSKMSHGEWGSATIVNTATDGTSQKGAANNGWKSLEDDAMGMGSGGEHGTGGWGRSGGSEGSAESSGGRSSSDSLKGGNRRKPPHNANLVSALTRSNVDPRVLSNAGWGQTPVQQNTAWDVTSHQNRQQAPRQSQKHPGWGNAPQSASQPSAGWGSAGSETGWGEQRSMSTWENKSSGSGSNQNTWDDGSNSSNTWSNSMNKDEGSNMWTNAPKPLQSWNGNTSESWGNNGEASRAGANNHWGDPPKGAGSMGWDSDSDRSGSGCWSEPGRTNTSSSNTWIGSGGSNTPDQSTPNHGSNWGETAHKPNSMSKNQGWGEPMKSSSGMQTWGEPTSKPGNPSNEWGKGSESSSSRGVQGTNKPSGWLGGPMPTMGPKEEMSTGWEEPSPESIRRRMEIDDGTAAWGDPGKSGSSVNMWNKSGQTDQDGPAIQHPNHGSMHSQQPMQPQEKSSGTGWGDAYPSQKESSTWGEPAAPMTVDNGTSAWEKPVNTSAWEDSNRDGREGPAWGSQHKSTHKPMGTWGGEDSNSWDQEEEVEIGMWNDNQQDTRSHEQNTWNYKQKNSKMSKPVPKQDEPWMKPFINQFNGMNFSRDSCDDSMKPGGMLDKHMGSMSDLNGVMAKNLGPRHPLHKDAMDRSPYFDKPSVAPSAYTSPPSDELSCTSQSMSFPNTKCAQSVPSLDHGSSPAHSNPGAVRQTVKPMVGGSSIAQGRGGPQSQVPPQHNLRNQVPPPILPSQVPPSLLKYPGGNGALNPLFGPQQVAVLNQLSQLNQLNQLQRLLLQQQQQQQQKAQSQRAMAVGRQSEQPRPIGSSPLMMQPPRHLDPSLMKQPQPMKPYLDNYFSHNNPDIQKEAASLGPFGNFPLSVNSNLNVSMDLGVGGGSGSGSLNYKEPPQSRLRKLWATDPLEQNSKPGAMSSGLRLDDSPFYDFLPSPLSPPGQSLGSVGDGWPPRANSPPPHGNTGTWPPEFRPGEPWKGYPNIDPQSDPHLTPGSVINNLSINTVRDTDHLRDRNNGPSSSLNTTMPSNSAWPSIRASSSSLSSTAQSTSARSSDSKWSPGGSSVSNSSLAHELWKVPLPSKGLSVAAPSRPPPGLPTQKPSASTSGWDSSSLRLGGWSSSESRFTPGSSWSDSSSGRTQWLVLKNLTPQIDGSTLKTLCMQHGPLDTFHLNLPHGNAVVCYRSKEEAAKAQKSLHMCVLGNTTILADIATEEEIKGFFAQGQTMASPSSGWQAIGSSQSRMEQSFPSRASEPNQWNSGDLHSSSLWGGPNYSSGLWGSTSGTETGRMSSSSPISSFLPVDHLTGAGDSM